jgi:hypothetical protein
MKSKKKRHSYTDFERWDLNVAVSAKTSRRNIAEREPTRGELDPLIFINFISTVDGTSLRG